MDRVSLTIAIVGLVLSGLTIAAIIYGPIAALKIQRKLDQEAEERKHDRERKQQIFRTLWVTRSTPLALRHVEALNLIELDYQDRTEVVAAWNLYLDHLNSDTSQQGWEVRRIDRLTDLIYEMGKALGNNYDKVLLKRHWYRPTMHGTLDEMDMTLRRGFSAILKGEQAFPVKIIATEQPTQPATASPTPTPSGTPELPS
jgi:hypothetical protein